MVIGLEWLVALQYPPHAEVVSKLNWRVVVRHEQFLLEGRVRLAVHESEALEVAALIHREDENHVVGVIERIR